MGGSRDSRHGQRALDVAWALCGLGVFAPFYPLALVLVLLDDGRPVFFVQERVGRNRRRFRVFKLRTMRDGQVTRVGRWLRATGLDETTQFANVLLGQMRMVGPRPLTPEDVERLGWTDAAYDVRFSVPPGITGLSQLFGGRGARHSARLDRLYLERASVGLDARIIAASFAVNLFGKRRTRRALSRLRRLGRAAGGSARNAKRETGSPAG